MGQSDISIALEYMDYGPLNKLISIEGALPEIIVGYIAYNILQGLTYLHKERKIAHRDLKPSNLLMNTKGEIKISDFGISKQVQGTEAKIMTYLGTRNYMSPERL